MLGDLVAVDAERTVRWLADPGRPYRRWERTAGPALCRRLVAADPPSLPRLGARWFHRGAFTALLRALPPERRGAFLDAVVAAAGPRDRHVRAHPGVLAELPPAERHARARAALAGTEDAWDRRNLLALLPPDEARPGLLAALHARDAEDRGGAWESLVLNAAHSRDPERVRDVLARAAGGLANEWDSVRGDFLGTLAGVPVPVLVAALADGDGTASLERVCRDALAARDRSPVTVDAVRAVAVALLADRTAPGTALPTAAGLLEALAAHTGSIEMPPLEGALDADGVGAVTAALGPWLDRSAARGDVAPLLALVASGGRRAYGVPELQDRLEKALAGCPDAVFAEVAAAWLADPATRGARVAELLAREPSAVFLPPVLAVLAAERTDLLDTALAEPVRPGGRFPPAGAARPLPDFRYAGRWLPRQQEAAVRLAAAVVADADRAVGERVAALRAVAPVPEHGPALLRRYVEGRASSGPADRALAAAALDAVAHTDDPASALGTLLGHAGDERAAAAWSAAARAAAHARPGRVAALLQDVLTRESGVKVTVRKTAARLAAHHLPPGAAVALLTAVARAPGVHPDVRATVVGLAPALLPAPEMWAVLESAVDGTEADRGALLDVSPAALAPAHRARFGRLMARLAFAEGAGSDFRSVSGLAGWARYAPEAGTALADLAADLTRTERPWNAVSGLQEVARSGLPHPLGGVAPGSLLLGAVDRLLACVAAGEPEGGGRDGDLPALRRLRSLLRSPGLAPGDCAALARRLAGEPAVLTIRTALLVRAVDLTASGPESLAALREVTAAVQGRPVLAFRTAEELEEAHEYGPALADPAPALGAVRTLGEDGGLVPGLLAVALAQALGTRLAWPAPCRTALVALRRHPDPDVRDLAYATDLSACQ